MDLALAIERAEAADPSCRERPAGARASFRTPDVRAVGLADPDWPPALQAVIRVPPALFVRGSDDPLPPATRCVALIGARRCTEEGRTVARLLAGAAARAGLVVISGLALGIDAAAHEGALDAGGKTLAVLASPVDQPTPVANRALAEEILDSGGWLVSERPPRGRVIAASFPHRNRLVAALAGALVVVEAGLPSGTLTTVEHALRLGRTVGAVPGSPLSPASRGANVLLEAGATPIPHPDALLALFGAAPSPDRPPTDAAELAVWRAVPGSGGTVAEWLAGAGIGVEAARAAMLRLIARGDLLRHGGRLTRGRA